MAKYIECETAIEAAKLAHNRIGNPYENIREVFDSIPAADVRPVRHGNWEKRMERRKGNGYEAYTPVWRCSDCGKDYDPATASIVNFCLNCGADMREES